MVICGLWSLFPVCTRTLIFICGLKYFETSTVTYTIMFFFSFLIHSSIRHYISNKPQDDTSITFSEKLTNIVFFRSLSNVFLMRKNIRTIKLTYRISKINIFLQGVFTSGIKIHHAIKEISRITRTNKSIHTHKFMRLKTSFMFHSFRWHSVSDDDRHLGRSVRSSFEKRETPSSFNL